MSFDLEHERDRLAGLAARGCYLGTSSWKYPGWAGLVYDERRYQTRGKFSKAKFEKTCLKEYARTYRSVCVDAGYYQFPTVASIAGLCEQVSEDFQFAFKVTDEITLKTFPRLAKFGHRAGQRNPNFLNPELFREKFLGPCEPFQSLVGPLIFEFAAFHRPDYEHGREFLADLHEFLGALPRGWRYAVELRNSKWLQPEYFDVLREHGVAHVFNSWTRMPPISEQLALAGSQTADFTVSRLLLKPGRAYADAVKTFQPYNLLKEPNDEVRSGAARLLEQTLSEQRRGYLYVNNRLEGCAPLTIAAISPA